MFCHLFVNEEDFGSDICQETKRLIPTQNSDLESQ